MAEYKLVNADQLDADLTSIADSIRTKRGMSDTLTFPDGFKMEIEAIDTQKEEQTKTITAAENGEYVITPDEGKVLSSATVNVDVSGMADGTIKTAYMPNVRELRSYAFFTCTYLSEIHMPLLQRIGVSAFYRCLNLVITELPEYVLSISKEAFCYCEKITQLTLSSYLNRIDSDAFWKCTGLINVVFRSIPTMANTSFRDCTNITSVVIPEGWNVDFYMYHTSKLTQESLHAIIENLADVSDLETPIFYIGETNIAKIDEDHLTMLDDKGWAYQ